MTESAPVPSAVTDQVDELIATLLTSGDPVAPERLVEVASVALPHRGHAGLTLLRPGFAPVTVAASDDVPLAVDRLQYALREGPCVDAATGPPTLLADDVGTDGRWPRFGTRCVRLTGVHSMLSLRLPVGGEDHAAINFYSQDTGAFTGADVTTASALVPLAALAVEAHLRRRDHDHLMAALQTSRQISTAVGILMTTHHVGSEQAFDLLKRASMNLNAKLRDVADEVTHTGSLPSPPSPPSRRRRRP